MPSRLEIDPTGRLVSPDGHYRVVYGNPWPTPNHGTSFINPSLGYVIHTEVGFDHGVEGEFESPSSQASALVSIAGNFGDEPDGQVFQYGPIGKRLSYWTQVNGNARYYGAENEDGGDPSHPLTEAQIEANAAVAEVISRHDGWPLVWVDHGQAGITSHCFKNGKPDPLWGNHPCPELTRLAQIPNVVSFAQQIRGGMKVTAPVAAVKNSQGAGHWLVFTDGSVWSMAGAPFYGSIGNLHGQPVLPAGVTIVQAVPMDGGGYVLIASDVQSNGAGEYAFNAAVWSLIQQGKL